MDSSYSMGGRPGFEEDKDSDAEDKEKEKVNNTVRTTHGSCGICPSHGVEPLTILPLQKLPHTNPK